MKPKKKKISIILGIIGFLLIAAAINQFLIVARAHSSFDNYYAFRGCVQLLEKADTYGICKTSSGATIKIVQYQNKWYLDGDLPGVW